MSKPKPDTGTRRLVPARTRGQNEILIFKVLDLMAAGKTIKSAAIELHVPISTMRSTLLRYYRRQGFRNTNQLLAAHMVIQTMGTKKRKGL